MPVIQRTLNVCFPRSGHRFLRDMCKAYFGKDLNFKANLKKSGSMLGDANYIKDHDFGLLNKNKGIPLQPEMKYLIQFRHPLESLASFFEFQVKHGVIDDSRIAWEIFLQQYLEYWKKFVEKWCISEPSKNIISHRVCYSDLCNDTFSTMNAVILYLTDKKSDVDQDRLEKVVAQANSGFIRYVEDKGNDGSLLKDKRDISKFKYFNDLFYKIEIELKVPFLDQLGIKTLLSGDNGDTTQSQSILS